MLLRKKIILFLGTRNFAVGHFLSRSQRTIVTVLIDTDSISFSSFAVHGPVIQKHFQKIPLSRSEVYAGIIFNQTNLKKSIRNFLHKHSLLHAFVALGLQGTLLREEIICIEHNGDVPIDIAKKIAPTRVWNFHFLPRLHTDKQQLYFFSMAREIIMQYQLLALVTPFNCCLISSSMRALLEVAPLHGGYWYENIEMLHQMAMQSFEQQDSLIAFHTGLFLLGKQVINESIS